MSQAPERSAAADTHTGTASTTAGACPATDRAAPARRGPSSARFKRTRSTRRPSGERLPGACPPSEGRGRPLGMTDSTRDPRPRQSKNLPSQGCRPGLCWRDPLCPLPSAAAALPVPPQRGPDPLSRRFTCSRLDQKHSISRAAEAAIRRRRLCSSRWPRSSRSCFSSWCRTTVRTSWRGQVQGSCLVSRYKEDMGLLFL